MSNQRIRIGKIDFTNVWPVFHHFPVEELGQDVELIEQVPSTLNREMAAGRIDMGPISSFAYGEHFRDYLLFPDLSVSAYGPVRSILLFTREPIEDAVRGRVALPTTSASSVNLLKVIVHNLFQETPDYFYAAPHLEEMMSQADAALLIGDDAIKGNWANTGYRVYDLGEVWRDWTGEWMSFAVWALRKDAAEAYPELVEKVLGLFMKSKERGLAEPEGMIRQAIARVGGEPAFWRAYFGNLCYDFGAEQQAGLLRYYAYCHELGLLPEQPQLQIWPQIQTVQVNE